MKKINIIRAAALAMLATFSIGATQAASIEGTLNFGGEAVAIPGPGIGDAIGLSFTSGFFVTNATGTFDEMAIGFADAGTLADFFFNPLTPSPVNPLLQILYGDSAGKFSYVLESVSVVDQSDTFLVLAGCGTLNGTGLDSTEYAFSMSVDGVGSLYAFSGTLAPKVVPVPGALLLFVSGLAALGIRRRN